MGIWLELPGLSGWRLVFQPAGVAIAVRLRRLVRGRGCRAAAAAVAVARHHHGRDRLSGPGFLHHTDLAEYIYPIDKTNLDALRFVHFLALATVTVHFIPKNWPALRSRWLRPAIICGQHSLEIFCLGVFLAFAAHFVKVEISGGIPMQIAVSVLGILIMIAVAWLLSWYKISAERKGAGRPKTQDADLAGGEA
jgi:hypothetical protein